MKFILTALLAVITFTTNAQSILFVTENGQGNGTSWEEATDLSTALDVAIVGTQIWVAQGTYTPTTTGDRNASFTINKDIKVYGGFTGNETTINQRNIRINKTVLSGEINTPDFKDNSYTIVTIEGVSNKMILDGFTITGGTADGSTKEGSAPRCGGAIFNNSSSPVISNCIFKENMAREGGALYNLGVAAQCNPIITNCKFLNNQADLDGGAIYNNGKNGNCNPTLNNCTLKDNVAGYGAGIYCNTKNGNSDVEINGCTFTDNMAYMWGGGIFGNDKAGFTVAIEDCSFAGNYPTDINKEITVGEVNTSRIVGAK